MRRWYLFQHSDFPLRCLCILEKFPVVLLSSSTTNHRFNTCGPFFIMGSRLVLLSLGIIFIFSIIVCASPADSDFSSLLPFDDPIGQDTSLSFEDQTTSNYNPLDPSSFDIITSPTNKLDEFHVSQNPDGINPSELLFNDDNSFPLAGSGVGSGCSASSDISLTTLSKRSRRVKRIDAVCHNGDSNSDVYYPVPAFMLPVPFDPPNHSKTCWELTLGVLPFALFCTTEYELGSIIQDPSKIYTASEHPVQYHPSTVYRATVCMSPLLPFLIIRCFFSPR